MRAERDDAQRALGRLGAVPGWIRDDYCHEHEGNSDDSQHAPPKHVGLDMPQRRLKEQRSIS